jgi:hypothetical protein
MAGMKTGDLERKDIGCLFHVEVLNDVWKDGNYLGPDRLGYRFLANEGSEFYVPSDERNIVLVRSPSPVRDQDSPPPTSSTPMASTGGAAWTEFLKEHPYENCTDYAFERDFDLALVADLKTLLKIAQSKGYRLVEDPAVATVVLYGKNGNYSHAIRKDRGAWYEVHGIGRPMFKYNGDPRPPSTHGGDLIVAMLQKS